MIIFLLPSPPTQDADGLDSHARPSAWRAAEGPNSHVAIHGSFFSSWERLYDEEDEVRQLSGTESKRGHAYLRFGIMRVWELGRRDDRVHSFNQLAVNDFQIGGFNGLGEILGLLAKILDV